MNNQIFETDRENLQSFLSTCYTFCNDLFQYVYTNRKRSLFANNDFCNKLSSLLLRHCVTFKTVFQKVLCDFPFHCNSEEAYVEYIVECCTLLFSSNTFQSFVLSCALIIYLLNTCFVKQCYRLTNTGPFSAFIVLKRLLECSKFRFHGDSVVVWIGNLRDYITSNLNNISANHINHITTRINKYCEASDAERLLKIIQGGVSYGHITHSHGTVLDCTELKLLSQMSVPTISYEDYANVSCSICLVCGSKCFIYFKMFMGFDDTKNKT